MRLLFLVFVFYLFFQGTAAADVFGLKMGAPVPKNRSGDVHKLADGTEELLLKKQLSPGKKGGEQMREVRLIFTYGGLSEFFMRYFGHGKNLAQATEDYTRLYDRIGKMLALDPEKLWKEQIQRMA